MSEIIIAKYEMERGVDFKEHYEYTQEIGSCNFKNLKIPEYCYKVVIRSFEKGWGSNMEITLKEGPILKVFYIGKEISLKELKEKYGNHPIYQYFTKRAEENGYRIVIDRTGIPHRIGEAEWETDEMIEVVEM